MAIITVHEVVIPADSQQITHMMETAIAYSFYFRVERGKAAVLCRDTDARLFSVYANSREIASIIDHSEKMRWEELQVFSADDVREFARREAVKEMEE